MEKVFSFESSPEHYHADACVVWCFDDRFYKLLKAFGKAKGAKHIDLVKVAGGAKGLAVPANAAPTDLAARDFLLAQIKASIRLHGTKRIILMTHRDCGAYGGSAAFADSDAERAAHAAQLAAARDFVASELPDVIVESLFADWDGLYAIDEHRV
jgi:carbonic anhydrase